MEWSSGRWWAYVKRWAGADAKQSDIAAKVHVDQSVVSRWKTGQQPQCQHVLRFARAYARPWQEALVESGWATEADFGVDYLRQDIADYPDTILLNEISHRMALRGRTERR